MDRKALLEYGTGVLALMGLAVAAYPFLSSMSPSARAMNDSIAVVTLPQVERGVVYSVDVDGRVLFILKPSEEQQAAIRALDSHVWEIDAGAYRADVGVYAYWAHSSKWGCALEHQPPQDSMLLHRDNNAKWLGGYWDGWCEVSYDYAGRAIKTYGYTYNGESWHPTSLRTPEVFQRSGDTYLVSKYHR